jgi:hypothetical protein
VGALRNAIGEGEGKEAMFGDAVVVQFQGALKGNQDVLLYR